MIVLYMLDAEGNVQVAPDPCTLATWMNDPSHIQIAVERRRGVRVSTVFLGYNYNFHAGPPIVFETMVFGGPGHIRCWQERYHTRQEALQGHARIVAEVFGENN